MLKEQISKIKEKHKWLDQFIPTNDFVWNLEYYYITDYAIDLCRAYMKNENITDMFKYEWVEEDDHYLFIIKKYKSGATFTELMPYCFYIVIFEQLGYKVGIHLKPDPRRRMFLNLSWYMNKFWKNKLNAVKVEKAEYEARKQVIIEKSPTNID